MGHQAAWSVAWGHGEAFLGEVISELLLEDELMKSRGLMSNGEKAECHRKRMESTWQQFLCPGAEGCREGQHPGQGQIPKDLVCRPRSQDFTQSARCSVGTRIFTITKQKKMLGL